MKSYIRLDSVSFDGAKRILYSFSSNLNLFHKKSFYVRYDHSVEKTPESILAVPFAALMAPVAWATGAELYMPSLDDAYASALEKCEGYWKKCFPKWPFSHRLTARLVENAVSTPEKYGMLFSGGLDSISTYVGRRERRPELYVVIGADIPDARKSFIRQCQEKIFDDFARTENVPLNYIYSDIKEVLDRKKLQRYAANWYSAVQFGLVLTALTAPLTHGKIKSLFISSCSHRIDYTRPCAGDPEAVRPLRWGGTQVEDDLNECARVEKAAKYLKPYPELYKYLRVCWMQHEKINCGRCEKCYRTICELLVNNVDPNEVNFSIDETSLENLKEIVLHKFNLFFRGNDTTLDYWRAIRRAVNLEEIQDMHGSKKFFAWLIRFKRLNQTQNRLLADAGVFCEKIVHTDEILPYVRKTLARLVSRAAVKSSA